MSVLMEGVRINIKSLLEKDITGITDNNVYKRLLYLYITCMIIFESALLLSYLLVSDGFFKGKHPIISNLNFSNQLWESTCQIFLYNLIPIILIFLSNLLAKESKGKKGVFIPIGYSALFSLMAIFGVITGSWSFENNSIPPVLYIRIVRLFNILRNSGLIEISAYILVAAATSRMSLIYIDRQKGTRRKKLKEISLNKAELSLVVLGLILLFVAAYIESLRIING